MFFRHGIKFVLRDGKSILFFVLSLISCVLCVASVGAGVALNSATEECKTRYKTVGITEYVGGNYPNDSLLTEKINEIDFSPEITDGVIYYEKTENAFCVIDGNESYSDYSMPNSAVLAVTVLRQQDDTYFCRGEETLYARRDYDGMMLKVYFGDFVPEIGNTYLVNGTMSSSGSYTLLVAEDFSLSYLDSTYPACLDITEGDSYVISENSYFYTIADAYEMRRRHLVLTSSDHPEDLYPFQQGFISLTQGGFYSDGNRGCVMSAEMASLSGLSVGDTVTLHTAVNNVTNIADCYFGSFDFDFTLTLTGIFDGDAEYVNRIYVPSDTPAKTGTLSYTIGQFRFENGTAEEYLNNLTLPDGVRITVFDQGYGKAVSSLEDMSLLISSVCRICLVAGCAFLFLCGYLMLSNQKSSSVIMRRLGVNKMGVCAYFLCCTVLIALPACVIGCFCAYFLCKLAVTFMVSLSGNVSTALDLFSRNTYSADISAESLFSPPKLSLCAGLSFAVFFCLLGVTVVFLLCEGLPKIKIKISRQKSSLHSRSLKGGSLKYAMLSLLRGSLRTVLPVILLLASSATFLLMTSSEEGYRKSYGSLRKESTVNGFFTDIYGQKTDGLVLDKTTVNLVRNIDGISKVTAGYSMPYRFVCTADENSEPYYFEPMNVYAEEAFISNLKSGNRIIFTDDLLSSPEFLLAKNTETDFLDGFDESVFSSNENTGVCVVPSLFAKENNVKKGDTVRLLVLMDIGFSVATSDSVYPMDFLVVGTFDADNGDGNIYVPISTVSRDDTLEKEIYDGFTGAIVDYRSENGREISDIICVNTDPAYSFATFSVNDCTNLENIKQSLYEKGFAQVRQIRTLRNFIVFNDSSYLQADRSASQRVEYIASFFPSVYLLTMCLAFVISYLLCTMRKRECKIMHSLGQKDFSVFASFFAEQLILCIVCLACTLPLAFALQKNCVILIILFAVLWLLGCALSLLHIRKNDF